MKRILLFVCCVFALNIYSQDIKRLSVNGKIVVTSADKEGVSVYNTSANKGTVTDENGEFKIDVAINDVVEFGALQFKDFTVVINDKILLSKQMTVILVEEVNKLDEVVLLPFGLTGNLGADLENVRTYNVSLDDVYFGEGLTFINNKLIQLTWREGIGFQYDPITLEIERSFSYGESKEGWGLCSDGKKN